MEAKLKEKEQVVAALTQRLEQAAEQLDRLHRVGADRKARTAVGIPQELLEQQMTLTADLQRAVQQWEEMQLATTLVRVESQVSEVHDLISGKPRTGGTTAVPAPQQPPPQPEKRPEPVSKQQPAPKAKPEPESKPAEEPQSPAGGTSQLSSWEAMKAQMLGEPVPETPVVRSPKPSTDSSAAEPSPQMSTGSSDTTAEVPRTAAPTPDSTPVSIPHADPPAPVNVESASLEELQHAVQLRDEYINYLNHKIVHLEGSGLGLPRNWAELEGAPEELKRRVQALEKQLEEKLRYAEVQLSLERARLGREEMKLNIREEQLQKQLRRMGMSSGGHAEYESHGDDMHDHDDEQKGRRWLRFLGGGEDD